MRAWLTFNREGRSMPTGGRYSRGYANGAGRLEYWEYIEQPKARVFARDIDFAARLGRVLSTLERRLATYDPD